MVTTKRERLEAAFAGESVDRTPIALWRHFPVEDQDAESLAEATAAFQLTYDFDFIKVTPASSFCLKDWGSMDEWRGSSEGTREYTRRVITEPEGWRHLQPLKPSQGALGEQLRCLRLLKERFGQEVPIIQTIFSPLAQAKNLSGQDCLMEHLHRAPLEVGAGLETITATTVNFIDAALKEGVDGFFYAIQHASYRYFDQESYARFGESYDLRILEHASSAWLNVLHLHGDALIFELAGRYPVQVVNWHDRETWPDLASGKAQVNAAVCGGIGRGTIGYSDPGSVSEEAREALEALGKEGLILGTGCVVPIIAPGANLKAARRAVDFA